MFPIGGQRGFRQLHQGGVHILCHGRTVLQLAFMIFFHHAYGPVQQVAQVVGQVCIDPVDKSIPAEVAVAAQIDLPQQEIADSIGAEFIDQAVRIHYVADGFAHFGAVHYQPAVAVHFLRNFFPHGHQHNGPDNRMETNDLLAYQMDIRRPEFMEHFLI